MVFDVLLAVASALVTLYIAYLGVHVTLHPPQDARTRRAYKIRFWACGLLAVALIIGQTVRNAETQSEIQTELAKIEAGVKGSPHHTHVQFLPFGMVTNNPAYPFRPNTLVEFNVACIDAGPYAIEDTSEIEHRIYLLKPPTSKTEMVDEFKRTLPRLQLTGTMLTASTSAGQPGMWQTATGPVLSESDVKKLTKGTYELCVIAGIVWKDGTGLYETGRCNCVDAVENPSALVWSDCPFNRNQAALEISASVGQRGTLRHTRNVRLSHWKK